MVFSLVGYYAVMRHTQEAHREFIKEQLHNNLKEDEMELISLTDNANQIYWMEDGKEFLYKGEMYDVVKSKTIAGKTILYCVNDKKEKELIDNYNNVTKNNSTKDKKAKGTVEPSSTLFVLQNSRTEVPLYRPVKQYGLFISPLATAMTNPPLQPPKFA